MDFPQCYHFIHHKTWGKPMKEQKESNTWKQNCTQQQIIDNLTCIFLTMTFTNTSENIKYQ